MKYHLNVNSILDNCFLIILGLPWDLAGRDRSLLEEVIRPSVFQVLKYSCVADGLPAIAAVFISVDAGLCFCILNWTFSANLDRVLV